jgi:uncharacterized protein (TIGR02246 family)
MDTTTVAPTTVADAVFAGLEAAWNTADGAAFGAAFAAETDFVDIRGEHHRGGPEAMGAGHQAIFDTIYAGSTVAYRVDVAREAAPGVLVAVATSTLHAPGGPLAGVHHSRVTAVLREAGDRWEITAFQNTLVTA